MAEVLSPNAAAAPSKPVYLFYHIQNEKGESSAHPNACTLPVRPGSKVVLQDVLNAFPLRGTGSFHFRFQVAQDGVVMFLDVLDPLDPVPMVGGNVICKVLRLDTLKCAARQAFTLQPRQASSVGTRPGAASPATQAFSSGGAAARPAPAAGLESSSFAAAGGIVNRVASAVGFGPRFSSPSNGSGSPQAEQQVPRPAAAAAAPSPLQQQPPQRPPQPRPAAATAAAPSSAAGDFGPPSSAAGAQPSLPGGGVPMLKPVKAVVIDTATVTPPTHVDDDLKDKSAYVQAKVMERRKKLEDEQKARIAEIEATEAAKAQEQNDRETARALHAQRLKEWSEEPTSGTKKDIRVLLSSLDKVLWPDARWEPVSMGKLIEPRRVKATFLRACTLVHPDKQSGMDGVQKHVATQIFHILEAQFRAFQETNPM